MRLEREARELPSSVGALIRARSLKKQPKPTGRKPSVDAPLMRQLAGIGNNLNQVTHALHATRHRGNPPNLELLLEKIQAVEQTLQAICIALAERNK